MDDDEKLDPRYFNIILPDDDYDEDDELDALIEKNARRRRGRVDRGSGIHGT